MSSNRKFAFWSAVAAAALAAVAFMAGRWSASLKDSLGSEAAYPWDLHRKIGSADIRCETLATAGATGKFLVRVLDDGDTLVVASLNSDRNTVTAYALDTLGRLASDAWPLECR